MNYTQIVENLKELHLCNPDWRRALEKKFPMLVDRTPFVKRGQLFMRKSYESILYAVCLDEFSNFYIKNVKDDKDWCHKTRATNDSDYACKNDLFLCRNDFDALLKKSGVRVKSIAKVSTGQINGLHNELFY